MTSSHPTPSTMLIEAKSGRWYWLLTAVAVLVGAGVAFTLIVTGTGNWYAALAAALGLLPLLKGQETTVIIDKQAGTVTRRSVHPVFRVKRVKTMPLAQVDKVELDYTTGSVRSLLIVAIIRFAGTGQKLEISNLVRYSDVDVKNPLKWDFSRTNEAKIAKAAADFAAKPYKQLAT